VITFANFRDNHYSRTKFSVLVLAVLLLITTGCTKTERVYRVGILVGAETMNAIGEGFKAEMTRRGYVEGRNIIYDVKSIYNDPSGGKAFAQQFVKNKVDMILVFPGQSTRTVIKVANGSGIPIVFANAFIEGTGIVESVQNPGDTITGVRNPGSSLIIKSLEFLLEFEPAPSRILVIYAPSYPTNPAIMKELHRFKSTAGVELIELPVAGPSEVENALQSVADVDAIMLMPDTIPTTKKTIRTILNYADRHHIPVIGGPLPLLEEGTLLTINADYRNQGVLAASIADRIFKGIPAGTIPVITPEEQLFINYRKSRELGMKPSRGLLRQAKEIIK